MPSFRKFSAKAHLKEERIHPGWFLVEMVHIYVLFNPFQFVRTLFKKKKKKTMKPWKKGRPYHNGNYSIKTKQTSKSKFTTSNIVGEQLSPQV